MTESAEYRKSVIIDIISNTLDENLIYFIYTELMNAVIKKEDQSTL